MEKLFIIFTLVFVVIFSGCSKKNISSEETNKELEKSTKYLEENPTEKMTEALSQEDSSMQPHTGKNIIFTYEQGNITEVYINGSLVVENEYKNGLRAVKKGVDYCEFTYDSERDITSEIRNGKLITYLYKEQVNSIYLEIYGFNYEGNNYYYVRDDMYRINGINNENGELIAKYEYDVNGYKVANVLTKVEDEWVNNSDENFIGNINRIRYISDYFDIETELYYGNGVFSDSTTGDVIQ